MPVFSYEAVDRNGRAVRNRVEAALLARNAAAQLARARAEAVALSESSMRRRPARPSSTLHAAE